MCSATYVRWQRGTARIRRPHAAAATIDRYIRPAGPTAASLLGQSGTERRTDGQTNKQTDTVSYHKPCYAYYAGSANNS